MKVKVYIPYKCCSYDGCSSPYGCFTSEEKMWMWLVAEYGEGIVDDDDLYIDEYDLEV